ncbi:Asp-tRNA(Asn)/Glu-tRNA(Gln) amidotransferase subunit GatB [Patescibacteria group bacterium]|nr:Asp-tRNA(Asn)/Glu-tRNA(Gln) amidotransferase subunit GatB [Patescibacteria group bacterium]
MKDLVPIIGLEIHIELKTQSKMFCRCDNNAVGKEPNTVVCPICLGHPGTLPYLNKEAVHYGLLLAQALNFQIDQLSFFARKNYFYPDLPKGYQITQADTPLGSQGYLTIDDHEIAIERLHLEEDTGKLIHDSQSNCSLVDYNRAGTPLIELVTSPVITSATEARRFCQELQKILRYLNISNANMEQGEMRSEANISLQEKDSFDFVGPYLKVKPGHHLNNKVEVKNLNSFKALERAINYEIERQGQVLASGGAVVAETRGWNETKGITVSQRYKETVADYRYFGEPDLPPLYIDNTWLLEIKQELDKIELPAVKAKRWQKDYGWPADQADLLSTYPSSAMYSDELLTIIRQIAPGNYKEIARLAGNWLTSEVLKYCSLKDLLLNPITPRHLADLSIALANKTITSTNGQVVLQTIVKNTKVSVEEIIKQLDLQQVESSDQISKLVQKVIDQYPDQAAAYRAGKLALLQFFIGQVMHQSNGKANPKVVREILEKKLQ